MPASSEKSARITSQWNDFVAASPYGDVLQCLEWGDVKRPDWRPVPVALESAGRLDATALVLKRLIPRTGRSIFYVPRGPILDWNRPEIAESLVKRLREVARAHNAILIKVDPAVPTGTPGVVETLQRLGFPSFAGCAGRLWRHATALRDEARHQRHADEIMAQFHQKWRYNTRLAERKGVIVQDDCTRDDLETFHQLYAVTAQRDGFTGRPLRYFQKLWDALVPKDMARLFITYHNSKPLSAAICFVLRASVLVCLWRQQQRESQRDAQLRHAVGHDALGQRARLHAV
jgi:lipid II:glycine glycyltransferase (peptidoglycan interpeptide bridge formation enzyme)